MIISHKYKFIFLKTRKTAGTSIEISLSRFCGDDDIITPISLEDEAVRRLLGKKAKNYLQYASGRNKYKKYSNHIIAQKFKSLIAPSIWNNYYKFCFKINLFDRVISLYYFCCSRRNKSIKFDEWLRNEYIYLPNKNNWHIYTINNKVVV